MIVVFVFGQFPPPSPPRKADGPAEIEEKNFFPRFSSAAVPFYTVFQMEKKWRMN